MIIKFKSTLNIYIKYILLIVGDDDMVVVEVEVDGSWCVGRCEWRLYVVGNIGGQ
jgi:hypothetical protein